MTKQLTFLNAINLLLLSSHSNYTRMSLCRLKPDIHSHTFSLTFTFILISTFLNLHICHYFYYCCFSPQSAFLLLHFLHFHHHHNLLHNLLLLSLRCCFTFLLFYFNNDCGETTELTGKNVRLYSDGKIDLL